ncbi:MAG: hypothetical protein ABI166_11505 [Mucilaginibacter sp.]
MAANKIKTIGPKTEEVKHINRDNWEVMKPFVHFSIKALKVIGITLIAIVKALPMLKPDHKGDTVVKRR